MSTETISELTAQQVEQYLIENPTFFLKHEHLLADLYLPDSNNGGSAVSLIEKQISILRERNIESRKRLSELMENGERNDILFQKTRSLILDILSSKSLTDLSKRLSQYCQSEFQVDKAEFTLIASSSPINTQARIVSVNEVERSMPSLLKSKQCISGVFREDELKLLFSSDTSSTGSAIILPITLDQQLSAILVLGSDDPHYFQSGTDTLFLSFIGDVIAGLLPRFLV